MPRLLSAMATVGTAVVLIAGFGTAANGVNWASSRSPLQAVENNRVVAQAYGNFYNNGNVYATNSSTYRAVGSNEVYVRTEWYVWDKPGISKEWDWHRLAAPRSTEVRSSTSWATRVQSANLRATGTKARGAIRVLAARPWYQANPASRYAYPTFNY